MKDLHEFLTMGGYGAYVWPAYGIATAVVLWNALAPMQRLRRLKADIRRKRGAA